MKTVYISSGACSVQQITTQASVNPLKQECTQNGRSKGPLSTGTAARDGQDVQNVATRTSRGA